MCAALDVVGGASTQVLGNEVNEGVVYSVSLKRVRYGGQQPTGGHLQWNSHVIRTLKAGTVEKLVEHLAPRKDALSPSYRMCFLSTYRTFTSPDIVLKLLFERFYSNQTVSTDTEENAAEKTEVQSRVISLIHHWLDSYPEDFHKPPSHPLLVSLQTLTSTYPLLQRQVDNLLLDFETRDFIKRGRCGLSVDSGLGVLSEFSDNGEDNDGDEHFELCTLTPQQFAHCLTALDAEIFRQVVPHHCLDYIRDSRNIDNAPSVRACIQHFNRVSLIVIATILSSPTSEERGCTIERWIDIATECRVVKNFSSLKAILSGLQSSSIHRLRKSWQNISSSKLSIFHELSGLLATDKNHQTSRDLLTREGTAKFAECSPKKNSNFLVGSVQGVVPYLGMLLTDLTMVHSAHKDMTEAGLINFDKRWKLFELLAQLTLYQKSAFNYQFSCHSGLTTWLQTTPTLTVAESYQMSTNLEETINTLSPTSPTTNKIPSSPSRMKQRLKTLFGSKGDVISDSHTLTLPRSCTLSPSLPSSPTHMSPDTKTLSSTSSLDDLDRLDLVNQRTHRTRSNSMSPSIGRRYCGARTDTKPRPHRGHVIRVAMNHSDHCNYTCLLVTEADRAGAVVTKAIKKFSLQGSPANYSLMQLMEDKRTVVIPRDANVYFALIARKTDIVKATLLLVKKET